MVSRAARLFPTFVGNVFILHFAFFNSQFTFFNPFPSCRNGAHQNIARGASFPRSLQRRRVPVRSGLGDRVVIDSSIMSRKVRASQDTVVGNAHRSQEPGQCHRKQTADRRCCTASSLAEGCDEARVKRCGKSAPANRVTGRLGKPHRKQDQAGRSLRTRKRERGAGRSVSSIVRVGCWSRRAIAGREKWSLTTEPGLQARSAFLTASHDCQIPQASVRRKPDG
jgi:hypothetical protein